MPLFPYFDADNGGTMADPFRASTSLSANGKAAGSHNQHIIGTTPSNLLPTFAAFRKYTDRSESIGGYKTASMATRLLCPRCSQMDLMVKEVAIAATELDKTVQSYCNETFTRSVDVPHDDFSHTAHWIIDRLRRSKFDLQEAYQRSNSFRQVQKQHNAHSLLCRKNSPPNPSKRPAESRERDDLQGSKRLQSGASAEYQPASRDFNPFHAKDFQPGNRFPPTDSIPYSALPQLTSPSFGGNGTHRTLPSPSSLAFPSSAAPSLPPLNSTQSTSSPAISGPQPSTIHSASSSCATSQHIADLQHQVTLKSLALQTLQSEYATLLQKLWHERAKSQPIERETSTADQGVNELTAKNEDLSEQVKTLESQLEESERKRDDQRLEAAKEKEQWGRMLEMSGRLQNKLDIEKQRLLKEKTYLTQRIAMLEDDGGQRNDEHAKRGGGQQTFGNDYHSLAPATKLGQISGFVSVQSALCLGHFPQTPSILSGMTGAPVDNLDIR